MDKVFDDGWPTPMFQENDIIPESYVHGLFMKSLLTEFQEFWREHAERSLEGGKGFFDPKKDRAKFSLIFMDVLSHCGYERAEVIAHHGHLSQSFDYGLIYRQKENAVRIAPKKTEVSRPDSLKNFARFLEANGKTEGYLVIFDLDPESDWDEKMSWQTVEFDSLTIHVVGN
ncbi:MAG: hypothetical protein LBF38_04210 [Deltaproteobacteria bacterium]|jgi:hypothetical protein|nr:hypothetical protein [Deltaproteobacteria bacterium]